MKIENNNVESTSFGDELLIHSTGNLLELFAGSRSVGSVGEEKGMNVFSIDWQKFDKIDLVIDIEDLQTKDVPFVPDVVWASPDCTSYTIAAISTHRNGTEPKSDYAKKCDSVNKHFISLIDEWLVINPNLVFFIENPRGMLRKMPFMQRFKRHTVWYCFAGETKIITKNGIKQISTLCDREEFLLTNNQWVKSKIRNYGKQKIWELTLSRSGKKKIIRTTEEHEWFMESKGGKSSVVKTIDLIRGKFLTPSYLNINTKNYKIDNEWVSKGFVFGDGYTVKPKTKLIKYEKSVAQFCGEKDKAMLPFFEGFGGKRTYVKYSNSIRIHCLPETWKNGIPTVDDDKNKIFSWLSGYFAADGTVGKTGQCTISSASLNNLRMFETLCTIIGIRTQGISSCKRLGYGKVETDLYSLSIDRTSLTSEFFHIPHHKERFIKNKKIKHQPKRWSIVGILETNDVEEVYCAEVPNFESFTLGGNILTHNCTYGDDRAKPTDIWTNSESWLPRPVCHNGNKNCHHQPAPRGSKTGTQGKKGSYNRSKIPKELCQEIIESSI
jgi:DNA primase